MLVLRVVTRNHQYYICKQFQRRHRREALGDWLGQYGDRGVWSWVLCWSKQCSQYTSSPSHWSRQHIAMWRLSLASKNCDHYILHSISASFHMVRIIISDDKLRPSSSHVCLAILESYLTWTSYVWLH